MKEIRNRINEIRDYYRLSNRGFATSIGAKPATANNYLNGSKEPSLEFIMAILSKYIDVSADWLLRGEGCMFKNEECTNEKAMRELADAKVRILVQEGVIKELRGILNDRIGNNVADERKSLVG